MSKHDIQLIAVDLDGTLLTSQKTPAPLGCRMLSQAARQGVRVVLATARNAPYTHALCRQLGLDDPVICTNGAQVWSAAEGELWAEYTIPHEIVATLARLADEQDWELNITIGSISYWRARPGQAPGMITPNRCVVHSNSEMANGPSLRIATVNPNAIAALNTLCQAAYAEHCRCEVFVSPEGQPESLGIFPRMAEKGAALRLIQARLGIPPSAVLAIGDNNVDISLFEAAGIGVAMGNATARVQARADIVAPSNDQEGVAWAIQHFLEIEAV